MESSFFLLIRYTLCSLKCLQPTSIYVVQRCNLVAWYMESEVVNMKDEECISKTDDNLLIMPIPAKEMRLEMDEKHENHPIYEELIHEIERAFVRMTAEQSHEGTTRTRIIENDKVEGALSASQNFD